MTNIYSMIKLQDGAQLWSLKYTMARSQGETIMLCLMFVVLKMIILTVDNSRRKNAQGISQEMVTDSILK